MNKIGLNYGNLINEKNHHFDNNYNNAHSFFSFRGIFISVLVI